MQNSNANAIYRSKLATPIEKGQKKRLQERNIIQSTSKERQCYKLTYLANMVIIIGMSKTYSTSQIANLFDLHPNTIRLYESWGVISSPIRKENGYRVFTDEHIKQLEIVIIALRGEVIQNGLRKQAVDIIKTVAKRDNEGALKLIEQYENNIDKEMNCCIEAIEITKTILSRQPCVLSSLALIRQQAADSLNITIDTLRNWEMNGLLAVKRKQNGYRIYNEEDMQMLKIIRQLRVANYSLSAILRMTTALSNKKEVDIGVILNTPNDGEPIISVCDKLIDSLNQLKVDSKLIKEKIMNL